MFLKKLSMVAIAIVIGLATVTGAVESRRDRLDQTNTNRRRTRGMRIRKPLARTNRTVRPLICSKGKMMNN